jgi:3,4-dihydroxy 2-butanone 4-phosphate synthase/GTP cyclohydrolase II
MNEIFDRFASGGFVIVVDDFERENEGDLIILAEQVTAEQVAFMVRYTTGILCVAIKEERARTLEFPMMVDNNQDSKKTAFTVSVDFKEGLTTGVSAVERAATIRAISSAKSTPSDFVRPGHIFPLIGRTGGLSVRSGHTEAGIALAEIVGATPAALLSEIVNDDGSMARGEKLLEFAATHQIPIVSIEELRNYLVVNPIAVEQPKSSSDFAWAQLPTEFGNWEVATSAGISQRENVVTKFGSGKENPLVRIHSECFTGDVLHSQRCDCGQQLTASMQLIVEHGFGYILYLRNQEGRGIGLTEKIKAYQLQDLGQDTVDANISLGHPVDARDWDEAIYLLRSLNIESLTLLTNNPEKVAAIKLSGISCQQRSIDISRNQFNAKYLDTKVEKMGHHNSLNGEGAR